jgi:hypothetical protein
MGCCELEDQEARGGRVVRRRVLALQP